MEELKQFLKKNPDLKSELDEYENISLKEGLQTLDNKFELKAVNFNENFDEYTIAFIENDLNEIDKADFKLFLGRYPEKLKEAELFRKIKLVPDFKIRYQKKNALKRIFILKSKYLTSALSIAASVIIFISIWIFVQTINEQSDFPSMNHVRSGSLKSILKTANLNCLSFSENIFTTKKASQSIPSNSNINKLGKNEKRTHKKTNILEEKTKVTELIEQKTRLPEKEVLIASGIPIFPNLIDNKLDIGKITSTSEILSKSHDILAQKDNNQTDGYKTIEAIISDKMIEKILSPQDLKKRRKLTIWDFASVCIKGIGRLTGKNMELKQKYSEDGKLQALALQTENFEFSKNIKR
jgi:hypothetical protein